MKLHIKSLNNEDGAMLIIVLFALVMITSMGLAALATTGNDLVVSGNGKTYKQNLLRSNGAVMEVAALMSAESDPATNLMPLKIPADSGINPWLTDGTESGKVFDPEAAEWIYSGNGRNSSHSAIYDDKSGFTVVFKGIAPGASYDMTQPNRMWEYSIYGRSELGNGKTTVNSGYRKRF